jgi:glycosyltransferase involved in cell wall biosynthesis
MRILQLHNAYQQKGGEDVVVAAERALLEQHGHAVETVIISNDALKGARAQVSAALTMRYSHRSRELVAKQIQTFQPDLLHVHNTFPLLTLSVYDAAISARIPIIQTLHNFRTGCSNAFLLREGLICEKCWHGSPFWAAWYACYKNSRAASLLAADTIAYHRRHKTLAKKVDRFISLTEFSRRKFIELGIPADRICIKPNFVLDPGVRPIPVDRRGALFAGRLSPEKGILTLLEAWREVDYPLTIAGGGPLLEQVKAYGQKNVVVLGQLPPEELDDLMRSAAFLVVPSTWYEAGVPLVIIEALARGLPVLGSAIGNIAELASSGALHVFECGSVDSLRREAKKLIDDPYYRLALSEQARLRYKSSYSPNSNYEQLTSIYREVTQGRQSHSATSTGHNAAGAPGISLSGCLT